MSLLERINELRKANGNISINRLEKEAGLTRGSVAKWDDHAPSYEKLQKVADYFGVSTDYLLGVETQKEKQPGNEAELSDLQKQAIEFVFNLSDDQLMKFIKLGKVLLD